MCKVESEAAVAWKCLHVQIQRAGNIAEGVGTAVLTASGVEREARWIPESGKIQRKGNPRHAVGAVRDPLKERTN